MRRKPFQQPNNAFFTLSGNGGVARERVLLALQNPKLVAEAVRVGKCFQCKANEVDITGLCLVCRTYLNDEERAAAQDYYDGKHLP